MNQPTVSFPEPKTLLLLGTMWVSKIATCFLVPAWAMASIMATNALVPAAAFPHRSSSTSGNVAPKHPYHGLATTKNNIPFSSRKTTTSLKTVEDSAEEAEGEEIPRGGGVGSVTSKPPSLPTLADYRKFAIPCLGLWVAQPLLSLVDTAFVGLSARVPAESASQLAALGPATTFFDGATYLFAFLNVATTNLYATARSRSGEQSDQAEAVIRTASRVAARCGVGLMIFLLAFARPLLSLYIGRSIELGRLTTVFATLEF